MNVRWQFWSPLGLTVAAVTVPLFFVPAFVLGVPMLVIDLAQEGVS